MAFELAQVNIARLRAPLDDPQLADFVAALDPVNAAAERAPGFVWRLQTEDGDATAVRAFEWDAAAEPRRVDWSASDSGALPSRLHPDRLPQPGR